MINGFKSRASLNFGPFKVNFSNFFKDCATHLTIRISKISQTLWTNIDNDHTNKNKKDHNERRNVYHRVKTLTWQL